ncbi:hypothetical protein HOE37_05225 [Candidatus Woesearchaeota archaeon]|nr:hypothetical protein [Candidatus Woesearchaeota archaeon]MBT4336813.1 hypothetical protein [Candidatus Woesearchaeota archaeon]MBT4469481.1 hypothetical protein [Candidatus Woesearchaeota archaeon]MBT6744124.1 hypothetical protein [Candidatus Woesearchaeota archaeon]
MNQSKNNNLNSGDHKLTQKQMGYIFLGVILLVVVGGLLTFVLIGDGVGAGKATHYEGTPEYVTSDGGQGVKLDHETVTAVPGNLLDNNDGDLFKVILTVDTNDIEVGNVEFKLILPAGIDFISRKPTSVLTSMLEEPENNKHTFWDPKNKIINENSIGEYTFRLSSGNLDEDKVISFSDVYLYDVDENAYGPSSVSVTVTPVPKCVDLDGDNYGTGDIRGCLGSDTEDDCDDDCPTCYPGNTVELCDGKDSKCELDDWNEDDATLEDGETIPNADKQLGVCYGVKQVCESGTWTNAYELTPAAYDYDDQEKCDFIDHDCDGLANAKTDTNGQVLLAGCDIGIGGEVAASYPGNIYWELDMDDNNQPIVADPQLMQDYDIAILPVYKKVIDDCNLGGQGQAPKIGFWQGTSIFVCDDGTWYSDYDQDPAIVYKNSPDSLVESTNYIVDGTTVFETDGITKVLCENPDPYEIKCPEE